MLLRLSKASQTVIIVNQERAQEGVKAVSCSANKEAALVAYNKENKFAMKCNSLLCRRHIVFCSGLTEKDGVTISCIESTSIRFRSVGTRN